MPGCLIPGDLERIQEHVGDQSGDFVLSHFVVSEGALVAKRVQGVLYKFSVPSLVPAQHPDGRCVFLDADDRCSIHPVSPFGCSHCDTHLPREEGDRRMHFCVTAQITAHQENASYSQWCKLLAELNLVAKPLLERRAAMETLFDGSENRV